MFFKGQSFVKGGTKVSGRGRKRNQFISTLDVIEWRIRTELDKGVHNYAHSLKNIERIRRKVLNFLLGCVVRTKCQMKNQSNKRYDRL